MCERFFKKNHEIKRVPDIKTEISMRFHRFRSDFSEI